MRIAYATYVQDPADPVPDPDAPDVVAAFRARGHETDLLPWTAPDVDWAAYDCVLVRSTWDYTRRYAEFLRWGEHVSAVTRLVNPWPVVRRNTDKRYLRDLAAAGVPVVPTRWYEPGSDIGDVALAGMSVVKPAVSVGAYDTIRTDDGDEASGAIAQILASGRTAMVQPYLDAVDGHGEISVIVLGGQISHAIRKVPALTEGGRGELSRAVPVDDSLASAVARVLAAEPGADRLAYARVDQVPHEGEWLLMELELTEPALFLQTSPGAVDRLVEAVERAAAQSP